MVCHHAHSSFAGGGRTKDGDDVARSNRARPLCLRWARERFVARHPLKLVLGNSSTGMARNESGRGRRENIGFLLFDSKVPAGAGYVGKMDMIASRLGMNGCRGPVGRVPNVTGSMTRDERPCRRVH